MWVCINISQRHNYFVFSHHLGDPAFHTPQSTFPIFLILLLNSETFLLDLTKIVYFQTKKSVEMHRVCIINCWRCRWNGKHRTCRLCATSLYVKEDYRNQGFKEVEHFYIGNHKNIMQEKHEKMRYLTA